jgi:hypothetical protein
MKKKNEFESLVVRPIFKNELERWNRYLSQYHYLGYRWIAGKSLRYVATLAGRWVAIVGWGSAALKCGARDDYIGWDADTQYKRLNYVVNNVRYLILPWVSKKNLASKILSLNLKRLPSDFSRIYGHPVYLAETFVDESLYKGTCYKASNWIHVGYTKGYSKCNKGYRKNGQSKAVYLYPLCRKSKEILNGDFIPHHFELWRDKKMIAKAIDFPVKGLVEEIRKITDPRSDQGKRHPLETVLAIAVCAVLYGARSFRAIGDWSQSLPRKMLFRFGSDYKYPPSEPTIRRVIQSIDAEEFDQRIGEWLLRRSIISTSSSISGCGIAIDGKTLRGSHNGGKKPRHLLSAVIHKEGIVIAQEEVDEKTNEIRHFRPLLEYLDISGAVVTADAMHTQRDAADFIVEEKKGDYLFTVKGNQKTLMEDIEDLELKKNSRSRTIAARIKDMGV